MPKAYVVDSYHSISDPQKLAAYGKLAAAAMASFGGGFLARGSAAAAETFKQVLTKKWLSQAD